MSNLFFWVGYFITISSSTVNRYFEGQLTQLSELETKDALETPQINVTEATQEFSLLEENVTPRTDLPPLLVPLRERLHYLGPLLDLPWISSPFWRKHKLAPFFIGNAPALKNDDVEAVGDEWGFYGPCNREYKRRLVQWFSYSAYRKMNYKLAMSVFDPKINFVKQDLASASSESLIFLKCFLPPPVMKRLEDFSNNLIDYPLIEDVVPILATMYFLEHLPASLSYVQASILLCYGLQRKDLAEIEIKMTPHSISVDEDLYDAAKKFQDEMKANSDDLSEPEQFQQFAIVDREAEFGDALQNGGGKIVPGSVISVKSKRSKSKETEKSGKKRNRKGSGSKSSKKRS